MKLSILLNFRETDTVSGEVIFSYSSRRQRTYYAITGEVIVKLRKNRFYGVFVIDIRYDPKEDVSAVARFCDGINRIRKNRLNRAALKTQEGVGIEVILFNGEKWLNIWSLEQVTEVLRVGSSGNQIVASPRRHSGWSLGAVLIGDAEIEALLDFLKKIAIEVDDAAKRHSARSRKGSGAYS